MEKATTDAADLAAKQFMAELQPRGGALVSLIPTATTPLNIFFQTTSTNKTNSRETSST
jgi:hypothetical protein